MNNDWILPMTISWKLSKTVGRFIHRFARDQQGIAATEFALVLPIMLTLFGGAVELSNFLTVERKVLSVVQTTADLIGQETDISASDISDIYSATLQILDPYPTTGLSIGVSSVVFDEDTAAASEDWTSSYNGGSVSSATTLAADFEEAGKSVIIGPMEPISTYGASKLACEALISAYCHMFGLRACAFRFGNVVGPRQTHGVGYDFIRKLKADPRRLDILGDGSQSKPYIHVNEIIEAVLLADNRSGTGFNVFNVAPDDAVTVSEIAELSVTAMGLARGAVELHYGSDSRGWKGDVPIVRLDCSRIGALGWSPRWNSREAVERSLSPLIEEMERRET